MAKTGKKAELDKDGIQLPEKKGQENKGKAELDKEGIALGKAKVELDKDGINLAQTTPGEAPQETQSPEGETAAPGPRFSRRTLLIGAAGAALLLVVSIGIGGTLWYKASHKVRPPAPAAQLPALKPPVILNAGEIPLDPFMILYTPQKQGKAGLLIAEVTLSVNPKTAPNVKDKLYEIRTLIQEYLSQNVEVYTQFEINEMLKERLRAFDVSDVTFTRFELK